MRPLQRIQHGLGAVMDLIFAFRGCYSGGRNFIPRKFVILEVTVYQVMGVQETRNTIPLASNYSERECALLIRKTSPSCFI